MSVTPQTQGPRQAEYLHELEYKYKALERHTHPISCYLRSASKQTNTVPVALNPGRVQSSREAMAMAMGRVLVAVCAVVMAMSLLQAPTSVQAACSLNDVSSCLNAVTSNQAPSAACCAKVAVVDVPCFCNLVSTSSYPQAYVDRAVQIPQACGSAAYAHFQGTNCAGHIIN